MLLVRFEKKTHKRFHSKPIWFPFKPLKWMWIFGMVSIVFCCYSLWWSFETIAAYDSQQWGAFMQICLPKKYQFSLAYSTSEPCLSSWFFKQNNLGHPVQPAHLSLIVLKCSFGSWELKDARHSVVSPAFAVEGGCVPLGIISSQMAGQPIMREKSRAEAIITTFGRGNGSLKSDYAKCRNRFALK